LPNELGKYLTFSWGNLVDLFIQQT